MKAIRWWFVVLCFEAAVARGVMSDRSVSMSVAEDRRCCSRDWRELELSREEVRKCRWDWRVRTVTVMSM